MDKPPLSEKSRQEARALMDKANARKALIGVLVSHLEQSEDPDATIAAAEMRCYQAYYWLFEGLYWDGSVIVRVW